MLIAIGAIFAVRRALEPLFPFVPVRGLVAGGLVN
jgi:hypothetical protein